ncbi:hypothetical protein BOTBODRAFT_542018 [Botryobasidium botryosum FD-172 SS1]|uniref:Uncharacterized protein n=1 Tax=Botryobasidium botryosum (strain FD-172 SS1) TaxID=930990 RepID=A0A067N299_BOTB1|nr:hypothetical protein BOTBODRAFT_542018 [Botryobasidium botryosum FD-172 SS1]
MPSPLKCRQAHKINRFAMSALASMQRWADGVPPAVIKVESNIKGGVPLLRVWLYYREIGSLIPLPPIPRRMDLFAIFNLARWCHFRVVYEPFYERPPSVLYKTLAKFPLTFTSSSANYTVSTSGCHPSNSQPGTPPADRVGKTTFLCIAV